jgi:hypothetical protein
MPDLYARRRHRNMIVLVLSVGATVIGLGWLVMILGTCSVRMIPIAPGTATAAMRND